MKMLASEKFTVADYELFPEGLRMELIDGQLVREPSPTFGHQWIVGRLHLALAAVVGADRVIQGPIDIHLDSHNVFQPDVIVLEQPEGPERKRAPIPLVAIEVLSPESVRRDKVVKRAIYLESGVAEVWIVDPKAETVEVHDTRGYRTSALDDPLVSPAIPELDLRPRDVLRRET